MDNLLSIHRIAIVERAIPLEYQSLAHRRLDKAGWLLILRSTEKILASLTCAVNTPWCAAGLRVLRLLSEEFDLNFKQIAD
jgi:hypothetical protein